MPGYIPTALHIFQHKPPTRPQYAPHPWNKPVYVKLLENKYLPLLAKPT